MTPNIELTIKDGKCTIVQINNVNIDHLPAIVDAGRRLASLPEGTAITITMPAPCLPAN